MGLHFSKGSKISNKRKTPPPQLTAPINEYNDTILLEKLDVLQQKLDALKYAKGEYNYYRKKEHNSEQRNEIHS